MFISLDDCKFHGTIRSGKMKRDTLISFISGCNVTGHSYEITYKCDESPIGYVWEEGFSKTSVLGILHTYNNNDEFNVVVYHEESLDSCNNTNGYVRIVSVYEADLYYKKYHPILS